jgi:hypothetical protein
MKPNSELIVGAGNAWAVGVRACGGIKIDFLKSFLKKNLNSFRTRADFFIIIAVAETYEKACKIKRDFVKGELK